MSMPVEPTTTEPVTPQDPTGTGTEPVEPAAPMYAPQLAEIPESMRPLVEPHFKAWDTQVQERFTKVREEAEAKYEPWKAITEQYNPDVVQQAIQIAQYMEADPAGLTKALAEQLGMTVSEVKQVQQALADPATDPATGEPAVPDPYDQRFVSLERTQQQLVDLLTQNQQQEYLKSANQQLEETHAALHLKHGAYDERVVNSYIAQEIDPEQAVLAYKKSLADFVKAQSDATNGGNPPVVIPSTGGGVPTETVDLGKLTEKERKQLVADYAARAAADST